MPRRSDEPFDFAAELRKAAGEIPAEASNVDLGLSAIFEEEPVPLTVFVQDKKFLGNPPLSAVQYDAVRHIERIYYPALYPKIADEFETGKREGRLHIASASAVWREEKYWTAPLRMTNFATLQWGKGSGKDHICRVASMRIAYLLMCLNSPQVYYGMPEQDTIHLLNVASSSAQAQQAFFMPIVRAVKKGWFADKCTPRQNSISYKKNVESVSGHSDAETQEGLNLLLAIADEIDAFKSKKEMITRKGASAREPTKSAEGILNMMRTSASTRFPEVFKNVRISYPRYLGSTIQRLTDEARADYEERGQKSRHYVSGPLSTWEVNPRVKGKEVFAEDYREDPIMARAKYECRPARAINPYFRNVQAVDSVFKPVDKLPVAVAYVMEKSDNSPRRVWTPSYVFADDFYPVRGAIYTMHADLAVQGDRAGIAMAHVVDYNEYETITEDEDGAPYVLRETRPRIKVDFVISYSADQSAEPPREIQIRWARQLCFELIRRGFNIRLFTFDSFQCLSGDTKIPLLDGTSKTLRELEGSEPFWLYSINEGRVVPGLCTKAWKTGHRDDMFEVELDNGQCVRATGDHRFMLRDGTYRRADALAADDSLMPLYRRVQKLSPTSKGYEQVWHPAADGSGKRWRFTHSMVSQHIYGPVPKGSLTHHINCNERDNRPANLDQMTVGAHSELHRQLSGGRFSELWADPAWSAEHRKRISAAQTAAQRGKTGRQSRRYRHDITFDLISQTHQEMLLAGEKPTRGLLERRLGITESVVLGRVREAGFSSWKAYRDHIEGVSERNIYCREWKKRSKEQAAQNHKVVAVRPAQPEDVYDLRVEEHHNFAIEAGVFVHNSTDSMQILETKGIETDKVSTDLSEDPWRNLRDLIYEGRIEIPRLTTDGADPAKMPFLLREELLALSRMPNGRVDHPADGSKDLADALACSALTAVQIGGREEGPNERRYYEPDDFATGERAELPFGALSLRSVWTYDLSLPTV